MYFTLYYHLSKIILTVVIYKLTIRITMCRYCLMQASTTDLDRGKMYRQIVYIGYSVIMFYHPDVH